MWILNPEIPGSILLIYMLNVITRNLSIYYVTQIRFQIRTQTEWVTTTNDISKLNEHSNRMNAS